VECPGSNRSAYYNEESMIKNLIFDLGNVLLSWKPEEFFDENGYSPEKTAVIIRDIFRSEEWLLLDNGDITINEAINMISARSSLKTDEIRAVFDLRSSIIFPLALNVKMLPALKKKGFKLYFLSNFPDDIFDDLLKKYDFFKYFDGGLISARVNASKPGRKIYEILLEKYSLKPEECLFADDSLLNVRGAESLGIKSVHVSKPDDLRKHLLEITGVVA
jgi:epoxide hydrolase-like predicted phosphatase